MGSMSSAAACLYTTSYGSRSNDTSSDCCHDPNGIMADCRGCFDQIHDCMCNDSKIPCSEVICVACCVVFSPVTWICACTDWGKAKPKAKKQAPSRQVMKTSQAVQRVLPTNPQPTSSTSTATVAQPSTNLESGTLVRLQTDLELRVENE